MHTGELSESGELRWGLEHWLLDRTDPELLGQGIGVAPIARMASVRAAPTGRAAYGAAVSAFKFSASCFLYGAENSVW